MAQEELLKEKQMGGPVNCSDSELCIYLQALAEGFLPTYYLDTSPSVQSKSITIASKSWRHGRKTGAFPSFPSLMMSRNLTESIGAELLTSWRGVFLARTSALPEKAQDLTASAAECGTTWPGSLAKYDPSTHSLKTAQHSLFADLTECSPTLPRSGLMLNGECWERPTLAPRTIESASGLSLSTWPTPNCDGFRSDGELAILARTLTDYSQFVGMTESAASSKRNRAWPTPTVCGNYNRKGASKTSGDGLATAVSQRIYPTATATAYKGWSPNHNRADTDDRLDYTIEREKFSPGQQTPPKRLNPDWVEWLMGWPIGQTALKPLETDRFHEWLQQHGGC